MQLDFVVTSPVVSFIARIGTNTTVLNSTVVALPDGTYDYVIIVPASLTTPVTRVSVVITNTAPTNITGFTIQGCTGNNLLSIKGASFYHVTSMNNLCECIRHDKLNQFPSFVDKSKQH